MSTQSMRRIWQSSSCMAASPLKLVGSKLNIFIGSQQQRRQQQPALSGLARSMTSNFLSWPSMWQSHRAVVPAAGLLMEIVGGQGTWHLHGSICARKIACAAIADALHKLRRRPPMHGHSFLMSCMLHRRCLLAHPLQAPGMHPKRGKLELLSVSQLMPRHYAAHLTAHFEAPGIVPCSQAGVAKEF